MKIERSIRSEYFGAGSKYMPVLIIGDHCYSMRIANRHFIIRRHSSMDSLLLPQNRLELIGYVDMHGYLEASWHQPCVTLNGWYEMLEAKIPFICDPLAWDGDQQEIEIEGEPAGILVDKLLKEGEPC